MKTAKHIKIAALLFIIISSVSYILINKSKEERKREKFIEGLNNSMMENYPQKNIPIAINSDSRKIKN